MKTLWKYITVSIWGTDLMNEIKELFEDDEEETFAATLTVAATMIDRACEIYGKDKDETRKMLYLDAQQVDIKLR